MSWWVVCDVVGCDECVDIVFFFFFQAEDGIRDYKVTGVQTCALPISRKFAHQLSTPLKVKQKP